jgi:hypothetical protein
MNRILRPVVLLYSGVALALAGFALVDFLLHPLAGDSNFQSNVFRAVVILVLVPLTLLVAWLIIRRVPGNIVGPLLIVWSASITFTSVRAGIDPRALALFHHAELFGWLALFFMFLYFPDGNIYPPWAAPWVTVYAAILILYFNVLFFSWTALPAAPEVANPFFILPLAPPFQQLETFGVLLLAPPLSVLGVLSLLLRYRRGSPVERQQIKLLALFAGLIAVYSLVAPIAYPLLTGAETMEPGSSAAGIYFYIAAGLLAPVAIGGAVLRYRLWDIDLIIRQTVVYSILTVILSLLYFGSVLALQRLSMTVIGRQSPAAIVLSTLAIAASFTTLRRRIQERIDRRFYRHKYNARQVLTSFSLTLREEVDLERLGSSLLEVVEETMKPAHHSLWLRGGARQPGAAPAAMKPARE